MQVLPIDHFHTLSSLTDRKAHKCAFASSKALTWHLGDLIECYITVAFQEQHLMLFCDTGPWRIAVSVMEFVNDVVDLTHVVDLKHGVLVICMLLIYISTSVKIFSVWRCSSLSIY